jgi:hypothetical protein
MELLSEYSLLKFSVTLQEKVLGITEAVVVVQTKANENGWGII